MAGLGCDHQQLRRIDLTSHVTAYFHLSQAALGSYNVPLSDSLGPEYIQPDAWSPIDASLQAGITRGIISR